MNIVLDSSSSSTDEDDNSNFSEIWDVDDEAEIDDDEEVAWPFEKNVPKFIVRDGEQVTLKRDPRWVRGPNPERRNVMKESTKLLYRVEYMEAT